MLYDFIYMKCSQKANLCREKTDEWLPGVGGGSND